MSENEQLQQALLQKTSVFYLNKLYNNLQASEQQKIDRNNHYHLFYMLQIYFEKLGYKFQNTIPPYDELMRNSLVKEILNNCKKEKLIYEWYLAKIYQQQSDQKFTAFLEQLCQKFNIL